MPKTDRKIDWTTASVEPGERTLTVEMADAADESWNEVFMWTLGPRMQESRGGVWGAVGIEDNTITAEAVEPGSEDALIAFLNSVVAATNNQLVRDQAQAADKKTQVEEAAADTDREAQEMTDRFRAGEP